MGKSEDLKTLSIDELLARSVGTRPNSAGYRCWAANVEGDARAYLEGIEKVPKENVYQVLAVEIFEALGVAVSTGQLGSHLNKKCKCRS